jgi:omega-6 fatty acid desaturase (delta-12 desaturase)
MEKSDSQIHSQATLQRLRQELSPFGKSDLRLCAWQLANTFIPYLALWAILVLLIRGGYPFWLTFLAMVPAAFFLVRIFIFFHDCTHGSFFNSSRANRILGYITGILTFTPFEAWRHPHNIHHASYADLDHRGIGDIWTLTSAEYRALPRHKRLGYRIYRHPLVLFGFGPIGVFLISQRYSKPGFGKPERLSVLITNLALMIVIAIAWLTIGLRTYLLIQLPLMYLAGVMGIWLFYVQHQFEGVYWMRHEEWDPMRAALEGSSYYKLPKVLQWFSGHIGLHFIHHILPRIPNYRLQQALDATPLLQTVRPLSIRRSLLSLHLNLWDVQQHQLVSFRSLKALNRPSA